MAATIGAGLTDFDKLADTWKKDRQFTIDQDLLPYVKEKKELWNQSMTKYFKID